MIRFQRYALLVLVFVLALSQTADAGPFDRETFTNKTIDGRYNRLVNIPTTALRGNLSGDSFVNPTITFTGATTGSLFVYDATASKFVTLPQGSPGTFLRVNSIGGTLGYERQPQWQPEDNALISANFDPALITQLVPVQPLAQVHKVKVGTFSGSQTVTSIIYVLGLCGSTLTSGQNFLGLYQGDTLIAQTADQSATWGTGCATGVKTAALTAPVVISAGNLYVGMLENGTTAARFNGNGFSSSLSTNIGLGAGLGRYVSCNNPVTTLPSSTTGACGNASGFLPWFGVL